MQFYNLYRLRDIQLQRPCTFVKNATGDTLPTTTSPNCKGIASLAHVILDTATKLNALPLEELTFENPLYRKIFLMTELGTFYFKHS